MLNNEIIHSLIDRVSEFGSTLSEPAGEAAAAFLREGGMDEAMDDRREGDEVGFLGFPCCVWLVRGWGGFRESRPGRVFGGGRRILSHLGRRGENDRRGARVHGGWAQIAGTVFLPRNLISLLITLRRTGA